MAEKKRILSGMRATNPRLHLGNYEGALRNWVALQDEGCEMYCMVADYHALTTMGENPDDMAHNSREVAKDFVAGGIDPEKSAVFVQSQVHQHAELHLIFSMFTPVSWLERQPTYKEKLGDMIHDPKSPGARAKAVADLLAGLLQMASTGVNYYLHAENSDPVLISNFRSLPSEMWDATSSASDVLTNILRLESGVSAQTRPLLQSASERMSSAREQLRSARGLVDDPTILNSVTFASNDFRQAQHLLDEAVSQFVQAPYGLLGYPTLQAADILLYKPIGVPVGKDQASHLEIANDIAARFNRITKSNVFHRFKYMIPEDETRAKVPGLDADDNGNLRKMSKSYDNCIYINESPDETAKKIMSAYTTPSKIKKTDPGIPEGCAVCQYLKLYSPDWQKQWEEDVKGQRGCVQNKRELIESINEFLRPIRERRAALDDVTINEILKDGRRRASERAERTMDEVRQAVRLLRS